MLLIMTKSKDRATATVWHPISSGSEPSDLSCVDLTQPGLDAFTDNWFGWTHLPANRPEAAEVMPCC